MRDDAFGQILQQVSYHRHFDEERYDRFVGRRFISSGQLSLVV